MAADDRSIPAAHLLGANGLSVLLMPSGAGYSRWQGLAITRWHPGERGGGPGGYIYLRDTSDARTWSASPAPAGGSTRCWRDDAMVRFARHDGTLVSTLEIALDPEHAVEVRGLGLRNEGLAAHTLELTSYLELVLGSARADDAHPAYSKMFVQTACVDGVLLAWRRKKDPSEPDVWAAHALVVDGDEAGAREWETDRARFIGRDGSLAAPLALQPAQRLSGTLGTVLDPIFSLRTQVEVGAGQVRRAAFITAVGASRNEVLALMGQYRTPAACADVFARARAATERSRRQSGIKAAETACFQRLVGALIGVDDTWRASAATLARAEGGAPVLWAKGISGDLPIVLLHVDDPAQFGLVDELCKAQRWWRAHQLPVDLVVVNAGANADAEALDAALQEIVATGQGDAAQGRVFALRADQLNARFRDGLCAAACIVLDGSNGSLGQQLALHMPTANPCVVELPRPRPLRVRGGRPASLPAPKELEFWNGLGGFTRDGREYVTVLADSASTPAPWSHVVANPDFGFLVTATGGGYCWAINSQQNPITAWSNDAVRDPPGEVFLLRDVDDGAEWSATASPTRVGGATYIARFGPGYARFGANVHGIESELTQCVASSDPVKVSRLRLVNRSGKPRRIAIAQVVAWALGPIGNDPRATTLAESDQARGAVFARNAWREEFSQAVAFLACGDDHAVTGNDAACRSAAVVTLELAPGANAELVFLLGEGEHRAAAEALVERYRKTDFNALLDATAQLWDSVLQPLQVETPQRSIDLLVNRCLPYQVLACRLWARTAFYQASGAFGFRDQLQDIGALCVARPDLARQHILLSASRQFEEGDVQHWWLPPSGKGVRTRIVDDRLWLPFIVSHYVEVTGDAEILNVRVPFVHGDALQPGQTDAFFAPAKSAVDASLFEHCARAIDASLATGAHGLPLMGTGDWNDGMNRVGVDGRGESVWMGWFLIKVIGDFAPVALRRNDPRGASWRDHARMLELALETKAWDGGWYRRAFYDDGTPLGTSADTECRIESMAQSWAVISGRSDPERVRQAMRGVNEQLVRSHDGVVVLFTEPFDETSHDPGYIKGYPPGLRENGGQYTHGSIWSLIAFALLGDGDKAGELLEIFDPIRKSNSPEKLARYKVEPYVECADVYSVAPHAGRGGWTWYSGSAGWLYRAIVEWVLGFRLRGDRLHVEPCIPRAWKAFSLVYRRGASTWRIEVGNPGHVCGGNAMIEVDGVTLRDSRAGIALVDDGAIHHVRVTLQQEPS